MNPKQAIRPLITAVGNLRPTIHPSAFIDPSARIIGDVAIAEGVSIWPMAVLRADSASITVGPRAAILDLSLLEAPLGHPVAIGAEAIISHGAIIHGATIEAAALVGIGAVVLDGAVVGRGSIVAAQSLVTAGTRIPEGSLVMGSPARIVRTVSEDEHRMLLDQVEGLFRKSRSYGQEP
jgi:carbonic anhydrase/acetyltransferase-like protein (isoleucine patch superfamily)